MHVWYSSLIVSYGRTVQLHSVKVGYRRKLLPDQKTLRIPIFIDRRKILRVLHKYLLDETLIDKINFYDLDFKCKNIGHLVM